MDRRGCHDGHEAGPQLGAETQTVDPAAVAMQPVLVDLPSNRGHAGQQSALDEHREGAGHREQGQGTRREPAGLQRQEPADRPGERPDGNPTTHRAQ